MISQKANNDIQTNLSSALSCDVGIERALGIVISEIEKNAELANILASDNKDDAAGDATKYLNLNQWLPKHLKLSKILNLSKLKNKRILDIGSGPGWFSYLAKLLGHSAVGIDIKNRPQIYKSLCKALKVDVIEHVILPDQRLPALGSFDYIVALMASFYLHRNWQVENWEFFLNELERMSNTDATILLELNSEGGILYKPEVYDLFIRKGYKVFQRFCIKSNDNLNNFAFLALQQLPDDLSSRNLAPCWRMGSRTAIPTTFSAYYKLLSSMYPQAVDMKAHKAIFDAMNGDYEAAITALYECVAAQPDRPGYTIALAQMLAHENRVKDAKSALLEALKNNPGNQEIIARLELYSKSPDESIATISPYWQARVEMLKSDFFKQMINAYPVLANQPYPADWYLWMGAVSLPLNNTFNPIVYWGLNHDVFTSGMDPLIHYLGFGQAEGRRW